jgi:hypothetical protein
MLRSYLALGFNEIALSMRRNFQSSSPCFGQFILLAPDPHSILDECVHLPIEHENVNRSHYLGLKTRGINTMLRSYLALGFNKSAISMRRNFPSSSPCFG